MSKLRTDIIKTRDGTVSIPIGDINRSEISGSTVTVNSNVGATLTTASVSLCPTGNGSKSHSLLLTESQYANTNARWTNRSSRFGYCSAAYQIN